MRRLAVDILEVELAAVEPPELVFAAGQWIAIALDAKTVRPYSMASPPSECRRIRLCVDLVPGGAGSRFFGALRVGDEVAFRPPLGTLTLLPGSVAPLPMVAEGIGVVPFRSILLELAERDFPRPATLHFMAGTRAHLVYHDELTTLSAAAPRLRYRPRLSAPDPAWTGAVGPVLTAVETEAGDLAGWDALLCGSGVLVRAARELCLARGIERRRIRYERFW